MKFFFLKVWIMIFPRNKKNILRVLRHKQYSEMLKSYYSEESLTNKRFFSFGAGNQRFSDPIWTYVDTESSGYSSDGIDVYYTIDDKTEFPKEINNAEVIFSSYLLEHLPVSAVNNYFSNSFNALKSGGILYSIIHDYDYAIELLRNRLIDLKTPLENRLGRNYLLSHIKTKIKNVIINGGVMVITTADDTEFKLDYIDSFVLHNCESLFLDPLYHSDYKKEIKLLIEKTSSNEDIYNYLSSKVTNREFHQHNADYYSKEKIINKLISIGFSKVRIVSIGQSNSPALWKTKVNGHFGFNFVVEAIK